MKKFKCSVCGYIYEGDAAPATCPVCGAPASEFIEEKTAKKSWLHDKNNNIYIIAYSTVMVVIVAAVLAFASLGLQSKQNANIVVEKKSAILMSIGQGTEADKAPNKTAYIDEEYAKYITDSYVVNASGDKVENADAFSLLIDLKAQYDKPEAERELPVFVSKSDDGVVRYILPVWGAGLWGPIWGYVALESDWDTIYGVVFDHKSETPGLGAEIATPAFEDQFKGKEIFKEGEMVSIAVLKGAGASAGNNNAVDAVSGGTITSRGVQTMLKTCFSGYAAYIEKQRAEMNASQVAVAAEEPLAAENINVNEESNE